MSLKLAEVEVSAQKLTPAERERLAQKLFESVHNQELTEVDMAWIELAEARFEKLCSGEDKGLSEDEFFIQARKTLE